MNELSKISREIYLLERDIDEAYNKAKTAVSNAKRIITINRNKIEGLRNQAKNHKIITNEKVKIVIDKCKEYSGLDIEQLFWGSRKSEIMMWRHALRYYLYKDCNLKKIQIAKLFNQDHVTIASSITVLQNDMDLYKLCNKNISQNLACYLTLGGDLCC